MHLGQVIGHLAEALRQACLQGRVEFFIDGGPHLLQLGGIGLVQLLQPGLHGPADLLSILPLRARKVGQPRVQRVTAIAMNFVRFGRKFRKPLPQPDQMSIHQAAKLLAFRSVVPAKTLQAKPLCFAGGSQVTAQGLGMVRRVLLRADCRLGSLPPHGHQFTAQRAFNSFRTGIHTSQLRRQVGAKQHQQARINRDFRRNGRASEVKEHHQDQRQDL